MIQIRMNEEMISLIDPLKERTELLDSQGKLRGYFEPVPMDEEDQYRRATGLFDPREIQRSQEAEGPWSTTDDLLKRLRSAGDV